MFCSIGVYCGPLRCPCMSSPVIHAQPWDEAPPWSLPGYHLTPTAHILLASTSLPCLLILNITAA